MKFWFDDESISEVLGDAKKVHMRATFLTWLSDKLKDQKKVPKVGLEACLKHLYACMEDRDGKVRAAAQACLQGFMIHLGKFLFVRKLWLAVIKSARKAFCSGVNHGV